jgi:hypothetical protein
MGSMTYPVHLWCRLNRQFISCGDNDQHYAAPSSFSANLGIDQCRSCSEQSLFYQRSTYEPTALIREQSLIVSTCVSRLQFLRDEDDTVLREMQRPHVLAVDNHGETIE